MMKDIFLKLISNILKYYMTLTNDLSFLPERMKIEKFVANLYDKKGCICCKK